MAEDRCPCNPGRRRKIRASANPYGQRVSNRLPLRPRLSLQPDWLRFVSPVWLRFVTADWVRSVTADWVRSVTADWVRSVKKWSKACYSCGMSWFTVRTPASSANLGPGFDALGLALGIYLTCRFRRAERLSICASGRDAESIPAGPENMIWRTAVAVAENHGAVMPPIELQIANDIPIGKGCGSSAAARPWLR